MDYRLSCSAKHSECQVALYLKGNDAVCPGVGIQISRHIQVCFRRLYPETSLEHCMEQSLKIVWVSQSRNWVAAD